MRNKPPMKAVLYERWSLVGGKINKICKELATERPKFCIFSLTNPVSLERFHCTNINTPSGLEQFDFGIEKNASHLISCQTQYVSHV